MAQRPYAAYIPVGFGKAERGIFDFRGGVPPPRFGARVPQLPLPSPDRDQRARSGRGETRFFICHSNSRLFVNLQLILF